MTEYSENTNYDLGKRLKLTLAIPELSDSEALQNKSALDYTTGEMIRFYRARRNRFVGVIKQISDEFVLTTDGQKYIKRL